MKKESNGWARGVSEAFLERSHCPLSAWIKYAPVNDAQEFALKALTAWVTDPDNPRWYPEGFKTGAAFLIGPPGVGKSFIARSFFAKAEALYDVDGDCWPPVWVNCPALMRWLPRAGDYWDYNDLFESKSTWPEPPFGWMAGAEWLFLDDLREPRNDAERQFVIDLFDTREGFSHQGAVVTTNLNAEALLKIYGERTFDRMNNGALWIPMEGKSLRRPQPVKVDRESEVNL